MLTNTIIRFIVRDLSNTRNAALTKLNVFRAYAVPVSIMTVSRIGRRHGVILRRGRPYTLPEEQRELIRLSLTRTCSPTKTRRELAEVHQLDIGLKVIRLIARQNNIGLRARMAKRRLNGTERQLVLRLLSQTGSIQETKNILREKHKIEMSYVGIFKIRQRSQETGDRKARASGCAMRS